MAKDLKYSQLLALYHAFLSEKQCEIVRQFYDLDYSLGEIAENFNISRQGVRDYILKAERLLDDLEQKLCQGTILAKLNELNDTLQSKIANDNVETIKELSQSIQSIINLII